MYNRILSCRECGETYFNWKKLHNHLIEVHGYVIEIKDDKEDGVDD